MESEYELVCYANVCSEKFAPTTLTALSFGGVRSGVCGVFLVPDGGAHNTVFC